MGNEASLEGGGGDGVGGGGGGEGLLSGLPEGLAPDGKGGFVRVPGGLPVDLSELTEEQRRLLEEAVTRARAQGRRPGGGAARRPSQGDVQQRSPQAGASRGSAGLSKSRTVDAFNQGPVGKPSPGRSPSSLSLFESKIRQEPKRSESKSSGMFGSSFLSGANPLSAMTSSVSSSLSSMGDSVNIPKFGIFGDEEEDDPAAAAKSSPAKGPQQQGPKGPQQGGPQRAGQGPPGQGPPGQGPKQGQGPPGQGPRQGQGPPGQGPKQGQGPPGQGPKQGQGPPGQGPKQGQGPPGQGPKQGQGPPGQGPKPGQGPPGPGAKQGGPPQQKGAPPPQGIGQKQQGPGAGGQPGSVKSGGPAAPPGAGKPCPLCKTTQMNVGSKEPPNYNNCTECKGQVCSLCGFSPPDSAGKEWLCLNCQMQRAMGGMDAPNPKQGSAPPSPQKQAPGKPGNLLIKQQSHQSDQGLTPPTTPRQKSSPTSPGPLSPGSSMSGSPKIDPKTGKPIMPKSSPQQSPSKPKQESSFFGGLGGISLGGLTDSVKPSSTSSQSLFGGFGGLMDTSPKPPAQAAPKQEESVAGKLFSGFGGLSDTSSAKPPAAASQMFSFGSSLLSSATTLVTGDDVKPAEPSKSRPRSSADSGPGSPVDSGPGSPPDSPFSAPGSPPDTDSAPDTPPARFVKPPRSISVDKEEKKAAPKPPKQSCPLCNTDINVGSSETANYSLCTECKKTVCNLCGFNPTPHLGEKEWLCLNCQTQRAMSGQLGDAPTPAMASPKKQPPSPAPAAAAAPTPPSTPAPAAPTPPAAPAVDSKPVVEPADPNPAAPDTKVESTIPSVPDIPDNTSITSPPVSPHHQEVPHTQTGNIPEAPAVIQKQNSLDIAEGAPKPEADASDAEPCVAVSVVAGDQEDKNTPIQPSLEESETLNVSTKTEIDNTAALPEPRPNLEISQSDSPADKQEKVSPAPDKLSDENADSGETKAEREPEATSDDCKEVAEQEVTQEVEPAQSSPMVEDQKANNTATDECNSENVTDNKMDELVIKHVEENAQSNSAVNDDKMMSTEPGCDSKTDIITETQSPTTDKLSDETGDSGETKTAQEPEATSDECKEVRKQEVTQEVENVQSSPIVEEKKDNTTAVENATDNKLDEMVVKQAEENIQSIALSAVNDDKMMSTELGPCDPKADIITETQSENDLILEKRSESTGVTTEETTEMLTEETVSSVKPVEENIIEVTPGNSSAVNEEIVEMETIEQSAIRSPVENKEHDVKAFEKEEVVAEGSSEVTAAEIVENRQGDLKEAVSNEELCIKKTMTKSDDNTVVLEASEEDVSQAHTHIEEKLVSSEQTGSSYSNEQAATNTKDPLPSDDTIQASAVSSEKVEISKEKPCQSQANSAGEIQHGVSDDPSALTGTDEKQLEEEKDTEKEKDFSTNGVESQPVAEKISISDAITAGENDTAAECEVEQGAISQTEENQSVFHLDSTPPLAKPSIPDSVVNSMDKTDQEGKREDTAECTVKPCKEDTAEMKAAEALQAPTEKKPAAKEGSPTSPSDLAKLENTVLPILEAQPKQEEQQNVDTPKTRRKLEVLPIMPDSPSSEEEREIPEQNVKVTEKKKLLVPMDVTGDSLEDSSESKESPLSGDDEDFIRKQIIEMSENEDASPTDEDNLIRQKIKEKEKKGEAVEKSAAGKARRLTKKATISPDDDEEKHLHDAQCKADEDAKESKMEESGTAVRKFQAMELNTQSMRIATSEGEVEMECLTDSPDDRSKGEGSSSLHASSFTPGTSPTSVSSFDEDSDSSSPSNLSTGEGKQQRKAKHRQPGQLPTIEDSSEEEEMREEEELLREQEKHRGSGKKSKKDKEDKSQRRRERSKTPPSNLSPIEDASPTEELRQEAEMEEIRRSSCSDFSPFSDPEGFEIHASKIAAVQKSYKLPVSAHSPTEETTEKKPLKTADETYEEIMLRAKSPTIEKVDNQPEKESLYGGMLIEDYAYTSLIDNSTNELEESDKIAVPTQPKKLRSPDEVYEDMLKKRKEFQKLEEEYQKMQPKQPSPTPEIVLQPADNMNLPTTITLDKDGKPLLDADTAYEELMKKVLTPGTSPTQQDPDVETTAAKRALYPIPDLKVTQCSSGELSSDDESFYKKEEEKPEIPENPPVIESSPVSSPESSDTTVTSTQAAVDLSALPRTSTPMMATVTALATVPQYTPGVQSVVSTAPPVPPKPHVMRRGSSQDSADMPVAPPPTSPKPTVFPRKAPVPLPPQASTSPVKPDGPYAMSQASPTRQPTVTPTYKVHVPPPVPPKPCVPSGMSEGPRAAHVKPPIAPKPGSQPTSPAHVPHPPRPAMLPTGGSAEIALNLSPTSEHKQFQASPKSPPSPRYASNLRDTYVVITLPSQPSSPVDTISTQAPSSPGPVSPSRQALPQSYPQPQHQAHPPQQVPPQPPRVPLAYTRVTESIENQEICSPEKHVSSSCHIIEAISASAQTPVVTPNLISQVVTTEVQRTTVSVVHERAPPPVPAPRANGVPLDRSKPQGPVQTTQAVQPCEVVDLRTMKVDQQSNKNGVDLSAGPDSRRQSYVTDASRQNSAVQPSIVNLSPESSTVSIMTDSITIVTCAATIQRWDNPEATQVSSVPLQLTKNKSFEPLSQIIYRPVGPQPPVQAGTEIPINLSVGSGSGTYQSAPITTFPPSVTSCAANGLTTGTATVAGAVDLSTAKPFNTVVSVDGASSDVVTAVITDDDGKPVDLTAGKRAVCCDVVYNLPFARSCTSQQPTTPLPEDRFGYRDDHYQLDRTPYGMRGFGGIKPSMSDTNLAEAGLFIYKSKNSYNFNGTTDGAVDLTSAKISDAGEAVDYSRKGSYAGMTIPPYSDARATSAVGTIFGTTNVLRSSNGIVYSSVGSPIPSTYAITTQPGSIFSSPYNHQSGMHTSDTMPSLSNLQNMPLTRSHSFLSTISITDAEVPLNLELSRAGEDAVTTRSLSLDTYTDASLEAIAASLEALSSPMVAGDGQYQAERDRLEMEKLKQQRLAEELERERQEIQRFREHEQLLVQKELEELQSMKQQILNQQEDERQAHLMLQKETYAQQQQQLEQIQRLQEQLRLQLEEQKMRQLYPSDIPGHGVQEAVVLGPDGTVLARKITDSGCQTDEEDETISKSYTAGRKKKNAKKSVDSCCQTDDEDQEEWEENRNRRPRTARGDRSAQSEVSLQAHTEISIQTDTEGNIRMESRIGLSDSERTSPKKRPTPLEIGQSTLQAPKSPKVLYSPLSPCMSPSKSLEFVSYEKSLGSTSPQKLSPRGKTMQRSLSDPKPMSPTTEERATSGTQYGDSSSQGKASSPAGTQKKVKRTLPNPPSEEESTATTTTGQTAYSTNSARRRMCRNSNMARAKILQDIDRELDLVERESSKLRKRQAELDEEEKEIDAKLRYLEMGINRRKDALLIEREKRERAYLQSVADERDYMSDSEVSHLRETRSVIGAVEDEEIEVHGLERPRTAPQSELDEFTNPQNKNEYDKYSQYPYSQSQYQQSLYETPQSYQSPSIYSSVPSLTQAQQQSYHQMLLLQQKAARQAALLSELDATKYEVINRQPDPTSSAYLGVKYDKYGNHLDLRALDVGGMGGTSMSAVSDSYYPEVDHHTPRSYMLLEDAAELAKGSPMSSSYSLAERELAKAEKLLRRSAADLTSTDYLSSTSRLHTYGKTPDEEDPMEEPYELKLLKQQLKQEFRRSTGGTESLEQHYYTPTTGLSSYSQRQYPKTDKYSISRLTLEKQAAKQLPASMLYQKHKTPLIEPKLSSKYSSIADRGLESEYTSYIGSSGSPRTSRLMQDEITFGLRKNIAEQQKYLGSNLGANLAGSLNLGQSLGLDSAYPSGSRSRPPSRPTSCYGLDLSLKRDPSSSSLRLKGDGESGDGSSYQTPSGRTKPTSLPIVQSGRGRIPIVAQNSEEESPLSPVGQPMGMARASAGPLPPISADSRDQFGSCLSLQDPQQQQYIREEPTRGRGSVLLDDLQGTMSDSEALSERPVADGDATHAYHLRQEETDWFEKPRDGRADVLDKRQAKGSYYPFPHLRVKLQRDPKDRSVSGNGLGIRVVGGKEVPNGNGDIGAYVAKVLPGGAAEQTGKILEGMQVLEWNGVFLTGKTYEEVQGLVGQPCNEAEVCVRLDLNMLAEPDTSQNLNFQEHSKSERPPRSPGVDPKQLAAELQKVSQQQGPSALPPCTSATSSPAQPGSPSVSKKRHSSKSTEGAKTHSHPISGEIQLQIHYDKQLGNLIVHVLQARNLAPRDNNGYSDPFVKVYLLPGRGAENKRRSKHAGKSINPEWNQTVIYKNIHLEQLKKKTLEVSVWDYDKCSSNDFLGEVLIDLSNTAQLDNVPRWLTLKEQSEGDHHRRSHSGQSRHSSKASSQHSSPKTGSTQDIQDSPKSSVTKSRSHGVFPDPAKDAQVPSIEKSHSSPGTSKLSQSEGQSQSHGHSQHSRSHGAHSKSTTRHHQDSGSGSGIATGQRGRFSLRHQRHSVVGVLTVQRAQSDWLPALPPVSDRRPSTNRHVTLRKAWSEERPQSSGARSSYRSGEIPVTAASLDSGLSGSVYSLLDEEAEANEVDSAIFQVPRLGKIPNGTDSVKSSMGHIDGEGKSHVMGEIKIALKKEVKTEGDHLVLEILQCRNITYKFKSPDHLPDLYVKLYVVNIATQKRIIKKKTKVCRHDREPSFNETFRFCMNPTGHALQLFLVSNGGKFMKKTLIGEAYVWLDKVDLRKRVVSWHKLHASTAQIHS